MKTLKLFTFVFATIFFSSCKKDYTCACTTYYTMNGFSMVWEDDNASYNKKMNKKTAQSSCDAEKASMEKSAQNLFTNNGANPMPAGESVTVKCTLK